MKTPSFWREVLLALVISVGGAVVHNVLAGFIGRALSLRVVVLLVAMVYVLSLLRQSPLASGRVVAALAWLALSLLLVAFNPALTVWLLMQTAFIWLLRGLQGYDSLISAGMDALLSAFALAAAVTTATHTQSLFLTLWCFFLVQALAVFVPRRAPERRQAAAVPENDFDASFRNAEAALRRLSVRS
jgi:hypothetical protein